MAAYKTKDLSGFEIGEKGWEDSSGGKMCKAKRKSDGATVFIKQYMGTKEPERDESTPPDIFAKRMKAFERQVEIRSDVNGRLRAISGKGGNIIVPYEEFVCDHRYTEVSEFVPGLMKPEEILKLSKEEKLILIKTAVNALQAVHATGIIHIDIKPPNVIAVRNDYGYVVGKIIDFDSSLLKDLPVPSETGGDQTYQSPELAYYNNSEGDPEAAKLISEKTDIFSLGLTLHYYLSGGRLPGYSGVKEPSMKRRIEKKEAAHKPVFAWEVLLGDGTLVMDSSLPKEYVSIIAEMTQGDPARRPNYQTVIARLNGEEAAEDTFFAPQPSDLIEWDEAKLTADGFTGIRYSKAQRKYELIKNGSVAKLIDASTLKRLGYAKAKAADDQFEDPRPEDGIAWDIPLMQKKGYTGVHPAAGGKYSLTNNGKTLTNATVDFLIRQKFAKKTGGAAPALSPAPDPAKPEEGKTGYDEPDPADGILRWDTDRLKLRNYTGLVRLGGGKYRLYTGKYAQGTYTAERLIALKYAIPGTKKEADSFDPPDPADGIRAWDEEKLKRRGYTGIRALGGGKYMLIIHGRNQGEKDVEKLVRLGYALK